MKTYIIHSLTELLNTVKNFNSNQNYWFRGHADARYILNPSAYRNLYVIADQFNRPVEPRPLEKFDNHGDKVLLLDQIYLTAFLHELNRCKIPYDKSLNIVDLYCLAQHYGIWTPMMDWTTDLTVALFFACDGRKKGTDCAIFLLDPKKWNEMACGYESILDSAGVIKLSNYFPLAMESRKQDKRMCRQSGNFMVHGHMVWPLEHYKVSEDILMKIVIPSKVADELELYLKSFGITKESIYVADDIKDDVAKSLKGFNEKKLQELLAEKRELWLNTPDEEKGVPRHIL